MRAARLLLHTQPPESDFFQEMAVHMKEDWQTRGKGRRGERAYSLTVNDDSSKIQEPH